MSIESPRFNLPFIAAAQAQKHVTHNEALLLLDKLIHLQVEAIASEPPANPAIQACYLIDTPSSNGLWANKDNHIACFLDDIWQFLEPVTGCLCWNSTSQTLLCYSGQSWIDVSSAASLELPSAPVFERLGIGTLADETNRLALKASASLFDNAGGAHRLVINKADTTETASLVLQTGYTGHAEIGLSGNNDLSFRVSTDGQNWITALSISAQTGHVSIEAPLLNEGANVLNSDNTPGVLNLKGTIGLDEDLDDFTQTGMWHQSRNIGASGGLNYPGPQAGLLTVISSGAMVYQTYRFYAEARAGLADATFTRGKYRQTWSAWIRLSTG